MRGHVHTWLGIGLQMTPDKGRGAQQWGLWFCGSIDITDYQSFEISKAEEIHR